MQGPHFFSNARERQEEDTARGGPSAREHKFLLQRRSLLNSAAILFAASAPTAASAADAQVAVMVTSEGELRFRLRTKMAPRATAQFTQLANSGFYDKMAFHALHPECVVGGDPHSRLGYGPQGTLIRGGFYYGKVRAWGSDESRLFGGAKTACPTGECTLPQRLLVEPELSGTRSEALPFGTLAFSLGGQPGMTVPSPAGTIGSIFEIHTGTAPPFYGVLPPVIGDLLSGEDVLRAISSIPVAQNYLVDGKGRSMPGSPSFARPRDVPSRRIDILSVRVE